MQAAINLLTLLSLYKLGTIQAAPLSSGKYNSNPASLPCSINLTQNCILSIEHWFHAAMLLHKSPGAVDPTDPQILREDIDDLRIDMENGYQHVYWDSKTRNDNMEAELTTLDNTVRVLQGRISELENWRAQTETLMKNVHRELREQILETNGKIHTVHNHANLLDDVVLQHHPESYKDLGYTLSEDATPKTDIPQEPAASEAPVETVQ